MIFANMPIIVYSDIIRKYFASQSPFGSVD